VKKTLIKIIKRKDAEAKAAAEILTSYNSDPIPFHSKEAEARTLRRKMDTTVSSWIAERRDNHRIEKEAAMQAMLDSEVLFVAA
jgi:hypothetical protein